jgi:transposase-like protein
MERDQVGLSGSLRHRQLTYQCPNCGFALVQSGGWFQAVSGFKCGGCCKTIRLTYSVKVGLFRKYGDLINDNAL